MVKYFYVTRAGAHWESLYRQVAYLGCVEEYRKTEGNVFYGLRKQLDWPQQKMAGKLGVDVKKLRALENSKTLPDSELVYKLYDMYCIPPAAVLKDAEGMANVIGCLLEMMEKDKGEFVFRFLRELHAAALLSASARI